MNVTITCTKCQGEFNLKAVDVSEKWIELCDVEKELLLTFYKCPECKVVHTVMIDDEHSLQIKREEEQVIKILAFDKRKNKNPKKSTVNRMYKLKDRLKNSRDSLNELYNMSFYQSGDVKEQLELSVPDTKQLDEKGEQIYV